MNQDTPFVNHYMMLGGIPNDNLFTRQKKVVIQFRTILIVDKNRISTYS